MKTMKTKKPTYGMEGKVYRGEEVYGHTPKKKEMTPYLACAIAEGFCEGERASEEKQIEAWQYLIDTGLCWTLQGWYGRTAQGLIEAGIIIRK